MSYRDTGTGVCTVPKDYRLLNDAFEQLLHDLTPISPAKDAYADWSARCLVWDVGIRGMTEIIRTSDSKRRLRLWTRNPSGGELEVVDWRALSGSRSIDWHGTIVSGSLIVLSDPYLKTIDRWPLFVGKLDWYRAKRSVEKAVRKDKEAAVKVSDAELRTWWDQLSKREQARPKDELHTMARKAFAGRVVSRERVRTLSGFRKPGPKVIE